MGWGDASCFAKMLEQGGRGTLACRRVGRSFVRGGHGWRKRRAAKLFPAFCARQSVGHNETYSGPAHTRDARAGRTSGVRACQTVMLDLERHVGVTGLAPVAVRPRPPCRTVVSSPAHLARPS